MPRQLLGSVRPPFLCKLAMDPVRHLATIFQHAIEQYPLEYTWRVVMNKVMTESYPWIFISKWSSH
jgi:hypothetical protein